ncbi:uncharacterized protein [Haliotis cracherodii]|uniref:uncharacterized protein isoform X1 n=1 Tax=Haliotis cracherodii TaxID=6455 RepID=UPI0039E9FB41
MYIDVITDKLATVAGCVFNKRMNGKDKKDRLFFRIITSYFHSLFSFLASFLIRPVIEFTVQGINLRDNPLKGKPRCPVLSEKKNRDVEHAVCRFVTYDAEDADSVLNFNPIKQNTECIFAKQAKVWGCTGWNSSLSLEENVYRSLPTLLKFSMVCEELGLDMFLIELPGEEYGRDVNIFGDAVRRVLKQISDNDPTGYRCMDKSYIARRGWVFEFNKITFFITTFAPCYPVDNSRYGFECDNCYVALQPEISFAQHDLPPDTPSTEWECPVTVRDKIRVGFRNSGREYHIRNTIYYPMAEDVVKPLGRDDPIVEWWKKRDMGMKTK